MLASTGGARLSSHQLPRNPTKGCVVWGSSIVGVLDLLESGAWPAKSMHTLVKRARVRLVHELQRGGHPEMQGQPATLIRSRHEILAATADLKQSFGPET